MPAHLTLTGRLTHPPRLTYADTGRAVATFTLAENRRTRTPAGDWADGPATFWRCSAFGKQAEHLAESELRPGDPVTVTGRPEARTWQAKDGTERTAVELAADVVAVGLARGPVTLDRRSGEHADQPPRDQPRATGPTESGRRDPGARLDRWQDDAPPF